MNWTVKLIKSSLIFQKPRKNQPLVANFHLSSPKPQSHQKQLPFLFLITKSKIEDVFLLWKRFLKWSKILSTSLELQLRLTTLQSDDPFTPNLFYLFRIRNSLSKQEPTNIKEIHNLSNLFDTVSWKTNMKRINQRASWTIKRSYRGVASTPIGKINRSVPRFLVVSSITKFLSTKKHDQSRLTEWVLAKLMVSSNWVCLC